VKNNVLAAIILSCLCLFSLSCTDLKAPVSTFKTYEIKNISFSKTDLALIFNVENPNEIPITLKDITYNIALDGSRVTSGTSEGFSLEAKGTKVVSFPVELVYADLAGTAGNLAQKFLNRNGDVAYKIDGAVSVSDVIGFSARVPLNAEGKITLF
jgi:LEA14-like dessication related protein